MDNKFIPYNVYILTNGDEHVVPTRIYVTTEILDKYIDKNNLAISPKFKTLDEMVSWLSPLNITEATKYAMSLIETEEDLEYMLMKGAYIVHKQIITEAECKVIDLQKYKETKFAI